jgi:pilus assembly protein CpaF
MTVFGKRGSDDGAQERAPPVVSRPPRSLSPIGAIDARAPSSETAEFKETKARVQTQVKSQLDPQSVADLQRGELVATIDRMISECVAEHKIRLDPKQQRDLVTFFVRDRLAAAGAAGLDKTSGTEVSGAVPSGAFDYSPQVHALVMERIDSEVAAKLSRAGLAQQLSGVVKEILQELNISLNQLEQRDLVTALLNDMLGLGPLETLLADDSVTDIMVNGPRQIYVERRGKLVLTDAKFRDDAHVMNIAGRIVSGIGRRIDESSPLVDARLMDGSRVNIIIPPLAIDGPSISIRKFSKKTINLDVMARQNNISNAMSTVLKIASRCQLNILISGGTGSGKTTLLNALSQMIETDERIVTIEDAAELQLQQPHVVRLETRPANLEGRGAISMRDLVKTGSSSEKSGAKKPSTCFRP